MSARARLAALALLGLPSLAAHADPLEAIKPLRCALVGASECSTTATCNDVQLEQIEIPDVVRIDFGGKVLGAPDTERTSPIDSVETFEEALVLQGSEWPRLDDRDRTRFGPPVRDDRRHRRLVHPLRRLRGGMSQNGAAL
jgi:hypothetical protein